MRSELLKSARDPSSPKGVNAPSPAAETAHRVMPGRAPTPHSARRSSHEQSTGGAQSAEQILAPVRLLQIEHDGFLVAVIVPEEERSGAAAPPGTARSAASRRFPATRSSLLQRRGWRATTRYIPRARRPPR